MRFSSCILCIIIMYTVLHTTSTNISNVLFTSDKRHVSFCFRCISDVTETCTQYRWSSVSVNNANGTKIRRWTKKNKCDSMCELCSKQRKFICLVSSMHWHDPMMFRELKNVHIFSLNQFPPRYRSSYHNLTQIAAVNFYLIKRTEKNKYIFHFERT